MKNSLLFLFFALFLAGCARDESIFIPNAQKEIITDLMFTVYDVSGQPMENASVVYDGKTYQTNELGFVYAKNQKVNNKHNVANFSKQGYFDLTKVFMTQKEGLLNVVCYLYEKSFNHSFNASSGGTINTSQGVKLDFPTDAIKYESGQSYSGEVMVAVRYIDPTSPNLFYEMPGDLSAIDASGALQILLTMGMVQVELESPSGDKLNIQDGKTVEMSVDIPSSLATDALETIPMWHFNEKTGYWEEDGKATKSGNRFVANVSHFSYWNYDYNAPSIILSGRIVDQNGAPISGAYVSVHNSNDQGGHGMVNEEGYFSGNVQKDVPLTLTVHIWTSTCQNILYTDDIGPFSADTDLGNIIITISPDISVSIEADIVDCDGNAVPGGILLVKTDYSYQNVIADDNGHISHSLIVCNPPVDIEFIPVDPIGFTQGDVVEVNTSGNVDLGTLAACGFIPDHIIIDCIELGFDNDTFLVGSSMDSLNVLSGLSKDNEFKILTLALENGNPGTVNGYLGFQYLDGNVNDYEVGTFAFSNVGGYTIQNNTTIQVGGSGNITVTAGGPSGSEVTGHFTGQFEGNFSGSPATFNGSFKLVGR